MEGNTSQFWITTLNLRHKISQLIPVNGRGSSFLGGRGGQLGEEYYQITLSQGWLPIVSYGKGSRWTFQAVDQMDPVCERTFNRTRNRLVCPEGIDITWFRTIGCVLLSNYTLVRSFVREMKNCWNESSTARSKWVVVITARSSKTRAAQYSSSECLPCFSLA